MAIRLTRSHAPEQEGVLLSQGWRLNGTITSLLQQKVANTGGVSVNTGRRQPAALKRFSAATVATAALLLSTHGCRRRHNVTVERQRQQSVRVCPTGSIVRRDEMYRGPMVFSFPPSPPPAFPSLPASHRPHHRPRRCLDQEQQAQPGNYLPLAEWKHGVCGGA